LVSERAFPVVYAHDVERTSGFYGRLGFEEHFRLPPEGPPGYVGLRRGRAEVAVVTVDSPRELIGVEVGDRPRFEMFIYVDDVDRAIEELETGGATVLQRPRDMPWGERVGYVSDPDGNPIAVAAAAAPPP